MALICPLAQEFLCATGMTIKGKQTNKEKINRERKKRKERKEKERKKEKMLIRVPTLAQWVKYPTAASWVEFNPWSSTVG